MIRKILCPSDLSNNSKAGISYAISLARENHAELVVFHAASIPFYELTCSCEVEAILYANGIPRFTVDQLFREAESKVRHFLILILAVRSVRSDGGLKRLWARSPKRL